MRSAMFIGHKTVVSPDFANFVVEPKAPKNYKDPVKIADYVQEAKNEIMNNSSFKPFTGTIEEICVGFDDQEGLSGFGKGFHCSDIFKGAADLEKFLNFLKGGLDNDMQAFTFHAYTFMRMVCMQAIKQGIKNSLVNDWLLNDPDARGSIVDLPKVFLPSSEEVSRVGYVNMFKYFGVTLTQDDMNDTQKQCRKLYELYAAADKFNGAKVFEISNGV